MIGSSDPKLYVEESEIGAKTGTRADDAEAEAEAEEDDTTDDDKTAGETVAEEIRKAAERRCLRRERRRADLDIGDKESGKRHSSDNTSKRLETGSGGRGNDKDDTLPDDEGAGDEKPEEEADNERDEAEGKTEAEGRAEEEETWFEVGEREARFEVVAPSCILAP